MHDPCVNQLAAFLHLDREVGEAVQAVFAWSVEDFPVNETAGAGKTDGPCSDAAERKGNLAQFVPE